MFTVGTFDEVLERTAQCRLICVNIPIGLSLGPERACDLMARKILGRPRAGSVYAPPIRQCLEIPDYPTASRICFAKTLRALNMHTFRIIKKIRQVDDAITSKLQKRIREVHTELSFYGLSADTPLPLSKKTPEGLDLRRKLLAPIFTDIDDHLPRTTIRTVSLHDIYDSLAAAWTAHQSLTGKADAIPDPPEIDSRNLKMHILLPKL